MSTIKDVFQLIHKDDWAINLDLKDAYFYVSITVRHRRFKQFILRGQVYRYTALPFSLSESPLCFTKVTKPVVQHLRIRGYRIVFYLDDILLLSNSRYSTDCKKQQTITLLEDLGFTLKTEKSSLIPSQTFNYLGLQWNMRDLSVRLPDDKVLELRDSAASLQSRSLVSARELNDLLRQNKLCQLSCSSGQGTFTGAAACAPPCLETPFGHHMARAPLPGSDTSGQH